MPDAAHSPARLLAPVALLVVAVAVFGIILGSDAGGDDDGDDSSPAAQTDRTETGPASTTRPRPQRRNYTVKLGDSLGAISEKTGVEVEVLQELNPELDPQALEIGQKIKLRE